MTLLMLAAARPDALENELSDFLEIIADVERAKDEVRQRYEELVEAWEDSWGRLRRLNPFNIGNYRDERRGIESIWDRIENTRLPDTEKVTGSILEISSRVVNSHTPVVSLFRTSSKWVELIHTPTSNVYADVWTPEDSRNLSNWDGGTQSRQAYDEIRDHQRSSTEAMVGVAADISVWLADVATGNVEFVTSLLGHLGTIANTLIAEAGKVANTAGFGGPWAVAELIGTLVAEGLNTLGTLAENLASMASNLIEADRIIGDHSYFPDGKWPEAVTRP